ncbi:uncharacterized protein LOC125677676 [Ostrea edulis]|uniref:uncharacterized protein LOC125677676 n=1 Tax=Ostrea edulis TaxID=37623 RepID=UPI0024AF56F9|nr:uncharacterized protein LOC125677676 [Ostrea edulis]
MTSWNDKAGNVIREVLSLLTGGVLLVFVYLFGRINCVEQRIRLSLAGIIMVGMSIAFSFRLSSAVGLEYGPLHSILPFFLLGIGVDNMFVVVGSYKRLSHSELSLPLNQRIGKLLRPAGVYVLVTSVTDILVFGVGGTTIMVVVITLGLLGLNIWGLYSLKQDYKENWFSPTDSYAYEFNEMKDKYFPKRGALGGVYCKNIDYLNSKTKFETLYNRTINNQYIATGSVDSWFKSYTDWLETNPAATAGKVTNNYPNTEADFADLLQTFLNNETNGKRHLREVVFQNNSGILDITTTYVSYQHKIFDTVAEEIVAMDAMVELVRGIFPETECSPYSRKYLEWEANKVIKRE